jgi:hypothetical protein
MGGGTKGYLHPSQRNLRTEQIGPSSHKNDYHLGVLEGNWQEARTAFGATAEKRARGALRFDAVSTHHVSFPKYTTSECLQAKPLDTPMTEAPRELLFGHGHGRTNLLSTNELAFTDHSLAATTDSAAASTGGKPHGVDQLCAVEGVSSRNTLSLQKKEQWAQQANQQATHYQTTNNLMRDATAQHIKEHYHYEPPQSSRSGAFVKSLCSNFMQAGLGRK